MWYRIIVIAEWFGEMAERYRLIRDFNKAAKYSFIAGKAPTLLESKITKGEISIDMHFQNLWVEDLELKLYQVGP